MGVFKIEVGTQITDGAQQGSEIMRRGQELNEQARVSYAAMDIDAVDSDTQEAVQNAHVEAKASADMLAQNELRSPAGEVTSALSETANKAREFGDKESANAVQAGQAVGEFAGIGGELANQLYQSSEEFHRLAAEGEQVRQAIEQEVDAEASALEGTW